MAITLNVGDKAPEFTLKDAAGTKLSLKSLRGSRVVVYFYPADDTPGCTKEACDFRDNATFYKKKNIIVIGVSPDDEASHATFVAKYSLPFTLLADPTHEVATAYGTWGKKTNYGKTYLGITRSTFLIDEDGTIIKIFPRVTPEGHAAQVLEAFGDRQ